MSHHHAGGAPAPAAPHPIVGSLLVLTAVLVVATSVLTAFGAANTTLGIGLGICAAVLGVVTAVASIWRSAVLRKKRYVVPLVLSAVLITAATAQTLLAINAPPPGVTAFSGGCTPFTVYAQHRWAPDGAARYFAPYGQAKKVTGFAGNEPITVDGWVKTETAPSGYTDPAPFNGPYWYHLADNTGWVTIAGIRANPTTPDPTGYGPAGDPPLRSEACEGAVR